MLSRSLVVIAVLATFVPMAIAARDAPPKSKEKPVALSGVLKRSCFQPEIRDEAARFVAGLRRMHRVKRCWHVRQHQGVRVDLLAEGFGLLRSEYAIAIQPSPRGPSRLNADLPVALARSAFAALLQIVTCTKR
jgi:hypothetical protein